MSKINKVLITGVAGFIGSNLLDYLIENSDWDIVGYDNLSTGSKENIKQHISDKRFKLVEQDAFKINSLKEYSVIFHLAALPRIQPSFELITEHITANVLLAGHLIEIMIKEEHYPRIVYSGSSAIYGTPEKIPTPETEKVDCLSPYAFQKYEVEKYLELIATRYPIDFMTLRYFNPYGPRSFNPENKFNAYSSVVGIFLHKHKIGEVPLVTGDGLQQRDFIHVSDLAKANFLAAKHPAKLNTAFNIGNGTTMSVLDLAKLISAEYKFIEKREGESDITFADTTKARNVLGWFPEHDIKEYIKNNLS